MENTKLTTTPLRSFAELGNVLSADASLLEQIADKELRGEQLSESESRIASIHSEEIVAIKTNVQSAAGVEIDEHMQGINTNPFFAGMTGPSPTERAQDMLSTSTSSFALGGLPTEPISESLTELNETISEIKKEEALERNSPKSLAETQREQAQVRSELSTLEAEKNLIRKTEAMVKFLDDRTQATSNLINTFNAQLAAGTGYSQRNDEIYKVAVLDFSRKFEEAGILWNQLFEKTSASAQPSAELLATFATFETSKANNSAISAQCAGLYQKIQSTAANADTQESTITVPEKDLGPGVFDLNNLVSVETETKVSDILGKSEKVISDAAQSEQKKVMPFPVTASKEFLVLTGLNKIMSDVRTKKEKTQADVDQMEGMFVKEDMQKLADALGADRQTVSGPREMVRGDIYDETPKKEQVIGPREAVRGDIYMDEKVQAAIEAVASGAEESVTIELPAKFTQSSEYVQSLDKDINPEFEAARTKYNRAEASQVALKHLNEQRDAIKLFENSEDYDKNQAEYSRLTKKIETMERVASKLEGVLQTQDRTFTEKGLDFFKKNIAEKWRTGKWYTKVGVGLALAGAGIAAATIGSPVLGALTAAAGFGLRGLGMYSVYQGVKNSEIAKLGNVDAETMTNEIFKTGTEAEKVAAIDQIIAENSWSRKGLFWGGLVGLISFGAQPIIEHSGAILQAVGIEHAAAAAPEAIAAGAGTTAPDAAALIPGDMPEQIFAHATVAVKEEDTMYEILTKEFNISTQLPEAGRQYNAIENILTQIKADPAAFGIVSGNVDKLAVGDTINMAKISEIVTGTKMSDGLGIFEHASKLPDSIVKGIEAYMPAGSKAILAAAVEQKAAVVTETAANIAGSVAVENTASAATNTVSTPEVQPLEQPTNSVGEASQNATESVVNAPVRMSAADMELTSKLSNMQINESAVDDIAVRSADLMKMLQSQGIPYSTAVRTYGPLNIDNFMNTVNPDATTKKLIDFIANYSKVTGITIPKNGTVLDYLSIVK